MNSRILHNVIQEFISCFERYIENSQLEKVKIYNEIVKRSCMIARDLRSITSHISLMMNTTEESVYEDELHKRVHKYVESLLQQDFLEFALNAQDESFFLLVPNGDIHHFLYMCVINESDSLISPLFEMSGTFGCTNSFFYPSRSFFKMKDTNVSPKENISSINFDNLLLSNHFDNSRIQFEEELSNLRRILEAGFSASDLNTYNISSIVKPTCEEFQSLQRVKNEMNPADFSPNLPNSTSEDLSLGIFQAIINSAEPEPEMLSWENCLKQSSPEHLYTSELSNEEALKSTTSDFQLYHSLLSSNGAVVEKDIVYDILDLLIGIPSDTFIYDEVNCKFKLQSGLHLYKLSIESTLKLVSTFIESGSTFRMLQKFCSDLHSSNKGLVLNGLQMGIKEILTIYTEYIAAVKCNNQSIHMLLNDVLENAQLLIILGTICGINTERNEFTQIPKGLGLLSHLHKFAWSHKGKESTIMIAVLLKYTYAPYFSYLNQWITEGACYDPYEEFQIMEDPEYLNRKDDLYWKYAYTENTEDPMRIVPTEIKIYSQRILDCGKSIRLLRLCCPELQSLKFMFQYPPPSFSMVFSFHAAILKAKESIGYINYKREMEKSGQEITEEASFDKLCANRQQFVDKKTMLNFVQRKWNLLVASSSAETAISKSNYIPGGIGSTMSHSSPSTSFKRCTSLLSLAEQKPDCGFSGITHELCGILFSFCGYTMADSTSRCKMGISGVMPSFQFKRQENAKLSFNFDYSNLDFVHPSKVLSASEIEISNLKKPLHSYKFYLKWSDYNGYGDKESCAAAGTGHSSDPCLLFHNYDHINMKKYQAELRSDCTAVGDSREISNTASPSNTKLGSFVQNLLSLLLSDYEDTVDDVYSCLQVTSIQRLIFHNFNSVLKMRMHLVEETIMKYIVNQLRLDSLLQVLRNIYFFHDECFSQHLCEQLFTLLINAQTPSEFENWITLNDILLSSLAVADNENVPYITSINVNMEYIPDLPLNRIDLLRLFYIEFEVEWPLNIIVHNTSLKQYMNISSVLMTMEFLCWLLGRVWRTLLIAAKAYQLEKAPQFRRIMISRFDMDQFLRIIRSAIHEHLQGPLWEFLRRSLNEQELSIDALEHIHAQYLERASARCFLTVETKPLYDLTSTMFNHIYRFCNLAHTCTWELNSESKVFETSEFYNLSSIYTTYKEYQNTFVKRIMKEALTKKFGRLWDKEYQDFLETISEATSNIIES